MLKFDRIEALMKLNNLTQTELLQKAKQSPNNFARWKTGKSNPSWSSVTAIANVLGVDPRYLLGQTDSPFGGEIIEKAMEQIEIAGAEVLPMPDPEGTSYAITFDDNTRTYNEMEFQKLCHNLITALNDAELNTSIDFVYHLFQKPNPQKESSGYTREEKELIENFRKLDADGKIVLQFNLINELRRLKK